MKTSIIITLCLAILQASIAQNEEPITESAAALPPSPAAQPASPAEPAIELTSIPITPPPPTLSAEPATESITSTETPTPSTILTSQIPELITEASTISTSVEGTTPASNTKSNVTIVEKLSEQIRSILKHFREPEPTGFPGQTVLPDPMSAPNATADLGLSTGEFYNLKVYGLSNFTVQGVNMLLDEMQVYVVIRMKKILVMGNFTLSTFITTSKGPFNMTLTNVTAEGTVRLKADSNGKLYADRTTSDLQYQELEVGSSATSLVRTAMNGAGMIVLAQIKPHILNEIEKRLNQEVNKQLETSPKIPKIVERSPVDLAVIEGRKYLRESYEPLTIKKVLNHESEYLILNVGPVTIKGLSKFARVGNITMQMKEGVIQLIARFITGRLNGTCKFFYDFGKVGIIRDSEAKFDIEYFQFQAKLNQSINLRKKPILDDLQLQMGKVRVKLDDTGDFDFLLELVVQLMPDMLKHLIVDSLEESIKEKLQSEILDKINLEQVVEDNLPSIQNFFVY